MELLESPEYFSIALRLHVVSRPVHFFVFSLEFFLPLSEYLPGLCYRAKHHSFLYRTVNRIIGDIKRLFRI